MMEFCLVFCEKIKDYSARKLLEEFSNRQQSHSVFDRLLQQINTTESADRKQGGGRWGTNGMTHTNDNVDAVGQRILSREDVLRTYQSMCQFADQTGINKTSM